MWLKEILNSELITPLQRKKFEFTHMYSCCIKTWKVDCRILLKTKLEMNWTFPLLWCPAISHLVVCLFSIFLLRSFCISNPVRRRPLKAVLILEYRQKFLVDEWGQRIRITIKLLNYCLPNRTIHQFRGPYAAHKSGAFRGGSPRSKHHNLHRLWSLNGSLDHHRYSILECRVLVIGTTQNSYQPRGVTSLRQRTFFGWDKRNVQSSAM